MSLFERDPNNQVYFNNSHCLGEPKVCVTGLVCSLFYSKDADHLYIMHISLLSLLQSGRSWANSWDPRHEVTGSIPRDQSLQPYCLAWNHRSVPRERSRAGRDLCITSLFKSCYVSTTWLLYQLKHATTYFVILSACHCFSLVLLYLVTLNSARLLPGVTGKLNSLFL